ncbi:c-type cytochrome [Desulfuromonas versatilis]|uniref:Cytochrome c oxidase subunit 2 n=1 Tax=Desulfuromonas versatilis TaxID=2802975 RepID=A0ABM8HY78_9BACT|nr:cytochrome c oxidase subunit II [Desulfuromonas versatilis]BCR06059.1 c-type cytochrome [Desulfuromonas versatilis]
MNPQIVSTTETVDFVFFFIFGISAIMLLGITAAMVYFVVRYNRKRHPHPTSDKASNLTLEVVWTVIPSILVMGMFYYGWAGYLALRNVPEGALVVKATGRMWSWSFEYANGKLSDKLYVPAGQPVKVDIHSTDVLHSFYIPAFRVKRDAVPGLESHVWFNAEQPGSYDIFCAEYCGVAHAAMISTVEALTPHEFEEWYRGEPAAAEADEGEALLTRFGCIGCHSLDGSKKVGPTFQGLFGSSREVLSAGQKRTLTADEEYLKRSILEPAADIVEGFPPAMPAYQGQISEFELEEIIEYFKRMAGAKKTQSLGEQLMLRQGCVGCHSTDGSKSVGPTLKGVFGRQVKVLRDGKELTIEADEQYLRQSLIQPQADQVQGYPPIMPTFGALPEEEIEALVEYLKTLQ